MPARNKSAKSSVEYLPEVKRRLSEMKIELRFRGVKHVSESEIIAFLILSANLDILEEHFRDVSATSSAPRRHKAVQR